MNKHLKTYFMAFGLSASCTLSANVTAAVISITDVTLNKGADYSSNRAGCGTPRNFVAGFTSTILTNGGSDGFDCGTNLPTATINPGPVTINPGPVSSIKLGEAALNERALIAFGQAGIPIGDGRGLSFLGMTLNINAGGQALTFNGIADVFQGGTPAFGNASLIATCDNVATAGSSTQCVDDPALDFRVVFDGPQSVTVGVDTFTFSVSPLSFFNRQAPVNITALASVTSSTSSPVPEPGSLALLGVGAMAFLIRLKHRRL